MNTYYHIDSKDDVTDGSLESEQIERDIQDFLDASDKNHIKTIPFGVSSRSGKGNDYYRTAKAS